MWGREIRKEEVDDGSIYYDMMKCIDANVACVRLQRATDAAVDIADLEQDQWCRDQRDEHPCRQHEYDAVLDYLSPCFRLVVLMGNTERHSRSNAVVSFA